jgi:hypothetical protein
VKRGLAIALAFVIGGAGVVSTRALVEGRRALAAGDEASERGDAGDAIERYRRAARTSARRTSDSKRSDACPRRQAIRTRRF